ncbi:MAG: hypothetical protein LBQ54_10045 [Planctomycetaceae bacterium]|nr:hypothetical protein [Planctomycetaceae bacterium]
MGDIYPLVRPQNAKRCPCEDAGNFNRFEPHAALIAFQPPLDFISDAVYNHFGCF